MNKSPILSSNRIKTFSRAELDYLCEVNPDMEVENCSAEKLKYIKIKNFLKHPIELREFCLNFPTEDTFKSISDNSYKKDRSLSPGVQQTFDNRYTSKISKILYEIMFRSGMIKYNNNMVMWHYYTNMFYPKMKSFHGNNYPHMDPFSFACNIYLSEVSDCKSGTNFFKCLLKDSDGNEKTFHNLFDITSPLSNATNYEEVFDEYKNKLQGDGSYDISSLDTYKTFQGDHVYKKFHFIPAEFNSVSLYKGSYWHNVEYDAENSEQYRYSLVGAICNMGDKLPRSI